jgi:hypothetical protein
MRLQSARRSQHTPQWAVAHVPPGPDPDSPDDPDLPDDPDRGGDLPDVNPGGNPENPGDNPAVREPGQPAEVVAAIAIRLPKPADFPCRRRTVA